MESTERQVRTWMASQRDEEIQGIITEISQGQTTLLNVVKALGEYLTSEEDELRTHGIELLSDVLHQCPPEKLNRQSVGVLATFYCSKLDDTVSIVPALKGIMSLASLSNCTSSNATSIIEAMFAHVNMKALVQSNRYLVFSIIDILMARHRETLKTMGREFLSGYIALAEGEKDPRNLLIAFAIARVILIEFDISGHVESLFNIIFCYFPITFRPPPNDPYSITTDDLKTALRSCLNATPLFGPMAIPLFLEKLTAGSPTTKRDTLQVMINCFPVYGAALARGNARKLWNSLKLEIFQPTDPHTEVEALKTMQILIKTIYVEEEESHEDQEDIQGLARDACEECIRILREPEKSQARPAIKVLCAFMSTTPSISRYTVSQAVPHLLKLFMSPDETSNRPAILMLMSELISAARDTTTTTDTRAAEGNSNAAFGPFKDEVLGMLTVGLKSISSRRPALDGLKSMITTQSLLADEEIGFIVHNVNEILQADPDDSDDASDAILDLLSTVSAISPRHVEEQTLPILFDSLPDQSPSREAAMDRAKYWRVLSALRQLCLQPELFEVLIIRLTTKLDLICAPSALTTAEADSEPSAAYAHSILTTIARTLSAKMDKGHVDIPKYIDRLVPQIFTLFIYSALSKNNAHQVATDIRLVSVAAQITGLVVQSLPLQKQEVFAASLFAAYLTGAFGGLAPSHLRIVAEPAFRPFDATSSCLQKNLVLLFAAGVVPLRKELVIPVPELDSFIDVLVIWSLTDAENSSQKDAIWHIVSSLLNKHSNQLSSFLSDKLEDYWSKRVGNKALQPERRRGAIHCWIWISKALLVGGHSLSAQFTDRLFEVFEDEDIGWDAARAIGEIASSDALLTKRNHCVVKVLYVQKFFNRIFHRIIKGASDNLNPRLQTAYLVALTSLIKSVPRTTYSHEMSTLMPLFLRGLDLPDSTIRANVIDTFLAAAEGDPSGQNSPSEHAGTLVTAMLKNSLVDEMPDMRVRIAALQYLGTLPSIVRYDILHPFKSSVIRQLAKVLDDPKRSVRKEAVDARTNWFKYNG